MLVRKHSEGTEEGVLALEEEVKATQNKVNNLEDALVDQHIKDMKIGNAICNLEKELKLYQKTQAQTEPATNHPVAGPSSCGPAETGIAAIAERAYVKSGAGSAARGTLTFPEWQVVNCVTVPSERGANAAH